MQSGLKRWLFRLVIQTPGAIFLVLSLTAVSLWMITYFSYVDVYLETTGEYELASQRGEPVQLEAMIPLEYESQIGPGRKVIYYFRPEGERFITQVADVKVTPDGLLLEMEADLTEFNQAQKEAIKEPLKLEIMLEKERVIRRLFRGEVGI